MIHSKHTQHQKPRDHKLFCSNETKKEDKNPQINIATSNNNLKSHQEESPAQSKYELHLRQRQHYTNHHKQPSYVVKDKTEASFHVQPYYHPLSRFSTLKQEYS